MLLHLVTHRHQILCKVVRCNGCRCYGRCASSLHWTSAAALAPAPALQPCLRGVAASDSPERHNN